MSNKNLSTDVYNVNDYVNQVKKEFISDVNEDTLMLGIFGYTGQIFSDMFQNTIVMSSEFSNESIPTKAKFEKNIIAHALSYDISNINAVPSRMDVLLTFVEDDIIKWANAKTANGDEKAWTFTFDKDNSIYFGDYEFHTDYDIIIKKVEVTTLGNDKRFAYTAQYDPDDFAITNSISDETNPYLTPPVKINVNGMNLIMVRCVIRQVEKAIQDVKILSDNDVSSKTITFTYEGQLASFSLDVTEGTDTYHMVPIYEGLNKDTGGFLYFWYTYLDTNTIRIKFDRNSKIPAVNATVQINLQTTQGASGNFTFYGTDYPTFTFESERLGYSNIMAQVRPIDGNAVYGADKKSIEDLKELIPVEALSRGSITNTTDLQNYFNMLDTDLSRLYFYKKRDNCLERLYYCFLLMKNYANIIPTNTIDIVVDPSDLQVEEGSGMYVLKQGQVFILGPNATEARLLKADEVLPEEDSSLYDGRFAYYLPYNFLINQSPLYGSYILTTIHTSKILDFADINENCLYQYIATNISLDRNCIEDRNTYIMSIYTTQNIVPEDPTSTDSPIHYDENGELVSNVDMYMIIYDSDNIPLRWSKAIIESYESDSAAINFQFKFTTEDYIDNKNRIRIDTGFFDIGSENESYVHLNSNMTAKLFVVAKQGESYGLGNPNLSNYIPNLTNEWSLSNTYSIVGGLDFFYDYSEIISSIVVASEDEITESEDIVQPDVSSDTEETDTNSNDTSSSQEVDATTALRYHIKSVPVVKYGYLSSEEVAKEFFTELVNRKAYIDEASLKLEDAFEMDFKFFNTYGPSKYYTWDNDLDTIDRTNISLFFRLKLKPNYDSNIIEDIRMDIKEYIENINKIDSIHIPNLVTEITNTYKDSIVFFEFVSINGFDTGYQHIYSMNVTDGEVVPEFVNINTLPDGTPDITIELV